MKHLKSLAITAALAANLSAFAATDQPRCYVRERAINLESGKELTHNYIVFLTKDKDIAHESWSVGVQTPKHIKAKKQLRYKIRYYTNTSKPNTDPIYEISIGADFSLDHGDAYDPAQAIASGPETQLFYTVEGKIDHEVGLNITCGEF